MNDLRLFLIERLCEAEAVAAAATAGPWTHEQGVAWVMDDTDTSPHAHEVVTSDDHRMGITLTGPYGDPQSRMDARFIAENDPARALRRIRAQLAMLTPHRRVEVDVLRLMAWEFLGHPDYRPEWEPMSTAPIGALVN